MDTLNDTLRDARGRVRRCRRRNTCGIARVDDAEDTGVAVLPGSLQRAPQLADVQAPASLLVQVVVHLDGTQFCQRR